MVGSISNGNLQAMLGEGICYRNLVDTLKTEDGIVSAKSLASLYKAKVIEAYRNRRIFTVFGKYNSLRRGLLERGWLEKLPPDRFSKLQKLSEEVVLAHAKKGNDFEAVTISKIINHFPAYFVWQPKGHRDLYTDVLPYRNRLRISRPLDFSTKIGLIACAEQQQWHLQDSLIGVTHPRFFRLGENLEEHLAFIQEYRITQCYSLLRYLVENLDKHKKEINDYENGKIEKNLVHFALARIKRKLNDCDNSAFLDIIENSRISEEDWESFLEQSSRVISGQDKIKCTSQELAELFKTSRGLLMQLEERHPDLKWDGYKNLWILKPGYMNRGVGIMIFNNLKKILQWGTTYANRHYIVQKYIERPLLIYATKFDIRQYMLICVRPSTLQVWLYKDCYLRFSSQKYCTDNLDESIHLTNNCVQKKYKNNIKRDARLPQNNMWSLDQFKLYLNSQILPTNFWENHIFAGFQAQLMAVVLPSLDESNLCENSFELFGCDFMLDEDYNPILIEINATPDLSASTAVTARICPMVLEDCLKVLIDLPRNKRSPTGLFTMVYEVNYKFKSDFDDMEGLNVFGKAMKLCKPAGHAAEQLKLRKRYSNGINRPIKQRIEKKASKLSARIPKPHDDTKALNAATKEALALKYTILK